MLELKNRILDCPGVRCFTDTVVQGGALDDLTTAIHEELPEKITWEVVYESLVSLAGTTLTEDLLDATAWRIAGNVPRLALHKPAVPWCRQEVDELVPVQVTNVHYGYTPTKKPGGTFELTVLAGTPASMVLSKFWTIGYCHLLKSMLGFSAPWGAYPFEDIRQFVDLRFTVRISSALSGTSPQFEKIWQENDRIKPQSLFDWNREIMRRRARKRFKCPMNYELEDVKCHYCWLGQDRCDAATHELTYQQRLCESCEKTAWFDPAAPQDDLCIACYRKSLRRQDG